MSRSLIILALVAVICSVAYAPPPPKNNNGKSQAGKASKADEAAFIALFKQYQGENEIVGTIKDVKTLTKQPLPVGTRYVADVQFTDRRAFLTVEDYGEGAVESK